MAHEKKHKKPLIVGRAVSQRNYLPDPYYIRSMNAIYIG
jgi:hypothetical protein